MTSNQINYWKAEEERRSNREQERLKQKQLDEQHQREMLDLAMKNLANIGEYGRTGGYEYNYSDKGLNQWGGNGPFGKMANDTGFAHMWEGFLGSLGGMMPSIKLKL